MLENLNPTNQIDKDRIAYIRRRNLLVFLAMFNGVIIFTLLFTYSKDLILALAGGVIFGYVIYKLFNSKIFEAKLKLEKIRIQKEILNEFLEKENIKFSSKGIKEEKFKKFFNYNDILEFHSLNSFEFEDLSIYDIFLKRQNDIFVGVLIISQKGFIKDKSDEKNIFMKKKNKKYFEIKDHFVSDKACLIASLCNPFFVNLYKNKEENIRTFKQNLRLIKSLVIE